MGWVEDLDNTFYGVFKTLPKKLASQRFFILFIVYFLGGGVEGGENHILQYYTLSRLMKVLIRPMMLFAVCTFLEICMSNFNSSCNLTLNREEDLEIQDL